jgi:hypothetical protein
MVADSSGAAAAATAAWKNGAKGGTAVRLHEGGAYYYVHDVVGEKQGGFHLAIVIGGKDKKCHTGDATTGSKQHKHGNTSKATQASQRKPEEVRRK